MINIPQWQASIGAFHSVYQCKKSVTTTLSYPIVVNDIYHHNIIIWFALLFYVMNVSFCALCLILSGDIDCQGHFIELVHSVMSLFILREKFAHVVTSSVKKLETLQRLSNPQLVLLM